MRLVLPIPLAAVIAAVSAFAALAVAPGHAGHRHEHPPGTSVSHHKADAHADAPPSPSAGVSERRGLRE